MTNGDSGGESAAIVAIGEAMVEFNAVRSDSPDVFVRGFGGDTSPLQTWRVHCTRRRRASMRATSSAGSNGLVR